MHKVEQKFAWPDFNPGYPGRVISNPYADPVGIFFASCPMRPRPAWSRTQPFKQPGLLINLRQRNS
jgi:hypothetical protein